jgi:hypothetical protein
VSAAEWLAANGYGILGAVFVDIMVMYGYGDYREVPAVCRLPLHTLTLAENDSNSSQLYVLKFFTPDIIAGALKITQGYMIG